MYNIEDKYFYEILEDYQTEVPDVQEEIFKAFCSLIWSSDNKRRVYEKEIKFHIPSGLIQTEIGSIFNAWSSVSYTAYRSVTKKTDFVSLLRQKVNNIYSALFDERICQQKEYMDLLKVPKQLYLRWIHGENFQPEALTAEIDDAVNRALNMKASFKKQKIKLEWQEYKRLIEQYFRKMFDNYISLDDYETNDSMIVQTNGWNEDNFCISYFCNSLNGYIKNYQKSYFGLKRGRKKHYGRCQDCGCLYEKNKTVCTTGQNF